MQVRPFSSLAYVLRFLWDGIPLLFWLGLMLLMYRQILSWLGIAVELAAPFALFGTWFATYALRPLRKFINLSCYDLMLRVPIKAVCELAIWKIILVHDRYWRSDLPDYLATTLFTSAYQSVSPSQVQLLNRILWQVEYTGKPHLAKPARMLLREVKAPLREDWVMGTS